MSDQPRKKVEYEVLEQSNIDNVMYYPGDRCFYAGLPSENLKPVNAEGESRAKEYKDSNAKRIAEMKGQSDETGLGIKNPQEFAAALFKQQKIDDAETNAERDAKMAEAIGRGIQEGIAQGMQALLAAQVPAQTATAPAPATEAKPADEHKSKSKQS